MALLELVKNASDADAPECRLVLTEYHGQPALRVEDDGSGMSLGDFRMRWMRIATNSKRERLTPVFQRAVTGQKGIGRFAIRFIGAAVRLTSITVDHKTKQRTRLEAVFDWRKLDRAARLQDALVRYRVSAAPADAVAGTQLLIWRLKQDLVAAVDRSLLTRVLQIASPYTAFNAGLFRCWSDKES